MNSRLIKLIAGAAICTLPSLCQDRVPVYRVTVIERTVDSVNYQYRADPYLRSFSGWDHAFRQSRDNQDLRL